MVLTRLFCIERCRMSQPTLEREGYTVHHNVLKPNEVAQVKQRMLDKAFTLVFDEQGVDVEHTEDNLVLFTDPTKRKEVLDNPNVIWRDGNSRQPLLSKSCGQISIHNDPIVNRYVNFNQR